MDLVQLGPDGSPSTSIACCSWCQHHALATLEFQIVRHVPDRENQLLLLFLSWNESNSCRMNLAGPSLLLNSSGTPAANTLPSLMT